MKSTVFIFHGTEGHPNNYWYGWLKTKLSEEGYEVIVPHFPSPPDDIPADVDEWHEELLKHSDKINEHTVFIGHSLGGLFALRVLEKLTHKVKATAVIASPMGVGYIIDFERARKFSGSYDFNWETVANNCEHFFIYYGEDDPYVEIGNGERAAKELGVELTIVPDGGHFNSNSGYDTFPQLLEAIRLILS